MSVINKNSTTMEILSEIRYTFMEKEFEVYQGIVVQREDDLKKELKKSKEDYDLLEQKHCLFLLDKLELEKELKSIKTECDSLKKKRFSSESETHAYAHQNMKKPKIETDEEVLMELRTENKKLKEEIELYRKKFPEHQNRLTYIEKKLADVKGKHASNVRAENVVDDHSPDDSICAQIRSSRNPAAAQSPNLQKEGTVAGGETMPMGSRGNTPSTGLNLQNSASDLKNGTNEPLTEAIFTESAAVKVEVSSAAIDRDKPEVIVIDSDDSDIDLDSDDVSIID